MWELFLRFRLIIGNLKKQYSRNLYASKITKSKVACYVVNPLLWGATWIKIFNIEKILNWVVLNPFLDGCSKTWVVQYLDSSLIEADAPTYILEHLFKTKEKLYQFFFRTFLYRVAKYCIDPRRTSSSSKGVGVLLAARVLFWQPLT